MFTDMVGFTASSQQNEAQALDRLREHQELLRPLILEHHGRLVKSTGDGFLVEFESALNATRCAVEIQRTVRERNATRAGPPLQLRIGIHLGDVESQGEDIFGDAVNIAARVEPLAEPGGVCVSEAVFGQVRNKISEPLEKLPTKDLKGLTFPIDIYRVGMPWAKGSVTSTDRRSNRLAILPFANFSPDPHDEYFADGLTEELITVLAQIPGIQVIARTSVFQYKATTKSVSQIGSELGVASLLEGSVRKAGNRIRISVQLIEVDSQAHAWAQSYDRELADVFAVQGEVAKEVAGALKLKLGGSRTDRFEPSRTVAPESYLAYLRGRAAFSRGFSRSNLNLANAEFQKAVDADARNARALAGLADTEHLIGMWYDRASYDERNRRARAWALKAVEIDPEGAEGHSSLGLLHYDFCEWAEAEREAKLALALNPSYSTTRIWYSMLLQEQARAEEAREQMQLAKETDPQSLATCILLTRLLVWSRRLDEARVELERAKTLAPESRMVHEEIAFYDVARGDFEGALHEAEHAELIPHDEYDRRNVSVLRAMVYALAGRREASRALLDQQRARLADDFLMLADIGIAYGMLGDLDECFRCLHKALDARGALSIQFVRLEPLCEPIRADPRFREILSRMKLADT
jgi:adenylate cyclase